MLSRIMALDVGEATLGVAVSDPLHLTARPLTTLRRTSLARDLRAVAGLVEEHAVKTLVVGMPLRLSGEEGTAAEMVVRFVKKLERTVEVPVIPWDERLTTAQAERALLEADIARRRRAQIIDQVAAALILQSYLDCRPAAAP